MLDPPGYGLRRTSARRTSAPAGKALPGRLSRHAGSLADIQPGGAVDADRDAVVMSVAGSVMARSDPVRLAVTYRRGREDSR
jgi:hypothetical protein